VLKVLKIKAQAVYWSEGKTANFLSLKALELVHKLHMCSVFIACCELCVIVSIIPADLRGAVGKPVRCRLPSAASPYAVLRVTCTADVL